MTSPSPTPKCFSVVLLLIIAIVIQVLVLLGYLPLTLATPVGVAIVAASALVREVCPPTWWQNLTPKNISTIETEAVTVVKDLEGAKP